jgi:hypothetical protein
VSRLDLRFIQTHPDRAGGLGILGNTALMSAPILSAQGAVLSRVMAGRFFFAGQSLQDFTWEIVGLVVVLVVLEHVPLMVFTPHLLRAKRESDASMGPLPVGRSLSSIRNGFAPIRQRESRSSEVLTSSPSPIWRTALKWSTACHRFPSARRRSSCSSRPPPCRSCR